MYWIIYAFLKWIGLSNTLFFWSFTEKVLHFLTISKKPKSKSKLDINKMLEILEKNTAEIDLKRLDESPSTNEISFITTFQNKGQLMQLREELFKLDNELEITFLDNTKVF